MHTVLTCGACRHTEAGDSRGGLMLKVKMWNHVNREHKEIIDRFREVVHTESLSDSEIAHEAL